MVDVTQKINIEAYLKDYVSSPAEKIRQSLDKTLSPIQAQQKLFKDVSGVIKQRKQIDQLSNAGLRFSKTGKSFIDTTTGQRIGIQQAADRLQAYRQSQIGAKDSIEQGTRSMTIGQRIWKGAKSSFSGAGTGARFFAKGVWGTIKGAGKLTIGFKNLFMGVKRFKMQFLSLMFISMQLNRTFMEMINPVLEMAGVFDLFRLVMIDILYPVLEPLLEMFYQLMEWFMDLPDPVKELIAKFILIGAATSGFLFVLSQLILLISSFSFGILGSIGLIAILAGSFALLAGKMLLASGQGDRIIEFTTKVSTFADKAAVTVNKFAENLIKELPAIIKAGNTIVQSLLNAIITVLPSLLNVGIMIITAIIDSAKANIGKIMEIVILIINSITDFLVANLSKIFEIGLTILLTLVQGIAQNSPKIVQAIADTITLVINWLGTNIGLLLDAGMQIIMAIANGLINNLPIWINGIATIIVNGLNWITANIGMILDTGFQILTALVNGIINNMDQIIKATVTILFTIINWVMANIGQIVILGLQLVLAIVEGIVNNLDIIVEGVVKVIGTFIETMVSDLPKIIILGLKIGIALIKGIIMGVGKLAANLLGISSDTKETGKDMTTSMQNFSASTINSSNLMSQALISKSNLTATTFNTNTSTMQTGFLTSANTMQSSWQSMTVANTTNYTNQTTATNQQLELMKVQQIQVYREIELAWGATLTKNLKLTKVYVESTLTYFRQLESPIYTYHYIIEVVRKVIKWFQGGGWVPETGVYGLHAGEYIVPAGRAKGTTGGVGGGSATINFNPVYNISVANKAEFETLIKQNNTRMVDDLRRMIEV